MHIYIIDIDIDIDVDISHSLFISSYRTKCKRQGPYIQVDDGIEAQEDGRRHCDGVEVPRKQADEDHEVHGESD